MINKHCKLCGKLFKTGPNKGSDQEYCSPTHRRYENTFQWILKLKKEGRAQMTKKHKIEKAVRLTVKHYGPALKKLAKE